MNTNERPYCDTCGEPTKEVPYREPGFGTTQTIRRVCTVDILHSIGLTDVTLAHLKDQLTRIYQYQKKGKQEKCDAAKSHLYINLLPRVPANVSDEFLTLLKVTAASGATV